MYNMDYSKYFELLNQDAEKERNEKAKKAVHDNLYNRGYRDGTAVLDKLRAEIAEYGSIMVSYAITKDTKTDKGIEKLVSGVLSQAKEQVLEVIDKYKAEIESQESEG